ncbi:MAG TPA: glutathione ABC transporter substrate-binding protein [Symbiobacteriaceae bacterium]|nr:glutathione ABC transporter substrate-binding protein [Symbiobacteriaceae bacterium]
MRKLMASLLALSMLVLTACSSGTPSTSTTTGSDAPATATPKEQKVVIAVGGEAQTLDPHKTFSGNSFVVTNQIYESLLSRGTDGTLQPRLATEWKSVNDTTWEFKLRQGVKFQDGTPFNAEAVKFSVERLKNPDTKGPGAYIVTMIKEVKVVDEYTVQFITDKPFAPLPAHLSHPVAAMVSPAGAKGDLGKNPIGTGPFKFSNWKAGESVTLVANPEYWGGKPKVETVVLRVIPEAGTQLVELKAGTIDLFSGIQPEKFNEIANDKNLTATKFLGWGSFFLTYNTKEGPTANPAVRKAIAMAIDRKGMVDTLRAGMAEVANAPVPKTVFGASTTVKPIAYDVAAAKDLLKQAGVTTPLKLKLQTYENAETKQIAGAIQAQLKEIGIDLEISVTDSGAFSKDSLKPDHGLLLSSWGTVTMDADYAFWAWYQSGQHQADNKAFYANAEVDKLLADARGTADEKARLAAYDKIQEIVQNDLPYLPLYYGLTNYAKNRRLVGEVFPYAMINLDLRKAEIK